MNRKFVIVTFFLLIFTTTIIWYIHVPNDSGALVTTTIMPTNTSVPTTTLSSWDLIEHKTPEATNTPHPNPYFPMIKTKIDLKGHAGTIKINAQTGVVYVADNFDQLLRIKDGIPQFQDELTVPIALSEIAIDQEHDRVYVLSDRYLGEIVEGTTVLENDKKVGYVPFPGRVLNMVFEPIHGWLYVYGYPSREQIEEQNLDPVGVGVLQILDGIEVIHEINPWEIRAFDAIVDSTNGEVYFSTVYEPEVPRTDSNSRYGQMLTYRGKQKISDTDRFLSKIHTSLFHPQHQTTYAFTNQFGNFDHSMTVIQRGEVIARQKIEQSQSAIRNGVVHPNTGELYLINTSTESVIVLTNELIPQYKTSIPIQGKDVGFQEIVADPFSGNVYLTNMNNGTLTIINGYEVVGVLDLDVQTVEMAVNPNNGDLYVSGGRSGNIWILGFEEGHVFPTE